LKHNKANQQRSQLGDKPIYVFNHIRHPLFPDEQEKTLSWEIVINGVNITDLDEEEIRIAREGGKILYKTGKMHLQVPARFQVCGTCDGRGKHINPSIDSQGLSHEDFDSDPDFAESYFSGKYDVTCEECFGRNVVPTITRDDGRYIDERYKSLVEREMEGDEEDYSDRYTRWSESGYPRD